MTVRSYWSAPLRPDRIKLRVVSFELRKNLELLNA